MKQQNILSIRNYLRKRKESNVIELIILDYNQTSFYFSIVYNHRIEKFKSVFVPLDIMDKKMPEEYINYQFITVQDVNYILETFNEAESVYKDSKLRDRENKNIDGFYIEINTDIGKKHYTFKTTQYIPKEWLFMFDSIVIMFEYAPNIVSELCKEILSVLTDTNELIEYTNSFNFDLEHDDLASLFKERLNLLNVQYLEKVNGKYYAIVDSELVIVDYYKNKKRIHIYCSKEKDADRYIYSVLEKIKQHEEFPFVKLMVTSLDKNPLTKFERARYYLCYGVTKESFKVIENNKLSTISVELYKKGNLKIIEDRDNKIMESVNS